MVIVREFIAFFGVRRNDKQFAIPHAAFGNQMAAEMFDFVTRSAQQGHFKAGMRVEVHMKR